MPVSVRLATPADRPKLLNADVFDGPVRTEWLDAFLTDARHHLIIAVEEKACVGFLSALDYIHPDKPAQMWINELGVSATHRRQGIATRLFEAAKTHARKLSCTELWVLADSTEEALGFYASTNATREGSHIAMFTFDLSDAT